MNFNWGLSQSAKGNTLSVGRVHRSIGCSRLRALPRELRQNLILRSRKGYYSL